MQRPGGAGICRPLQRFGCLRRRESYYEYKRARRALPTLRLTLLDMSPTTPQAGDQTPLTITPAQMKRERLRFSEFRFTRTPSGLCSCEVELEWIDGVRVLGKASGQSSPMGDLRIAADAALRALEAFSGSALQFELVGVKLLRAFDANVVIVSVMVKRGDGPPRLLGCYLAEHDAIRGTVVAVLNATNRVLGNFIATR